MTVLALDCDITLNKSQIPPDFREILYLVFFYIYTGASSHFVRFMGHATLTT